MRMRIAIVAACLVCLAQCTPAPSPDEGPELHIVSDAVFPPFHFIDDAGAATGFDIELARLVAERAGLKPVVEVKPYDALLSGLPDGAP